MDVRLLPMNPTASAASMSNHDQSKSFPTKIAKPVSPWKVADEMIGVSVPRKARSGSIKRSQECWISGGSGGGGSNGGEPIPRQSSTSPARPSTVVVGPPAPISPSSSNAPVRKKMKPIGTKHRPPKVSKTSSSVQESEIEIEIAEVLYGMTKHFQCPSNQEIITSTSKKLDSKDANGSSNDAKSRGSSPVAISPQPMAVPQPSVLLPNPNSTAFAPKRKRPRPLQSEEERRGSFAIPNTSVSSAPKIEVEKQSKVEISSPISEKNSVPTAVIGGRSLELGSNHVASVPHELPQDSVKTESEPIPHTEPQKVESDGRDRFETKEEIASPLEDSPCAKMDTDLEDAITTQPELSDSTVDCPRGEKFKIDLMAPPGKSSPERDDIADFITDQKTLSLETETEPKKTEEKADGIPEEAREIGFTKNKTETMTQDLESQEQMVKERILDLQFDGEKVVKDENKLLVQKQLTKATRNESKSEKAVQSVSLPPPMTLAGWPSGLPPIGYIGQIPPLPAVVSTNAGTGSSTVAQILQPPNFLPPHPRPKRCATHYYIAQNIYHRSFAQINPFWPGAAGSAPLYGAKLGNLNVVPPSESAMLGNSLKGSFIGRNLSSLQEKGSGASSLGHTLKDKNLPAMSMDSPQRKQHMLRQPLQPASANNILTPAFIFPLNQQQAAEVTQSGSVKSITTIGNAASSSNSANSVVGSAASSGAASATTVSFNYANLPTNDGQYLAMLQSNVYPFPIPAHLGAPTPYRGSHHPLLPFFNGSFYSPQMLHPSQLQQQQQQNLSQPPLVQPGNQNTSTSSGSSSSQKQQQQQQLKGCGGNGAGGISHGFPTLKQSQQPQQQYFPPSRHLESEMGNDDSPFTADSRASHAQKSAYNHNFAMPIYPPNFTLMSPAALGGGNLGEKQQHQKSLKGGMEFNQSQAFAMSFATLNGAHAPPSLDFSSMTQNHAVFQGLPEAARRVYQNTASAASSHTAQQKKPHQTIEDGKPVCNSSNSNASFEDERKMTGKASTSIPHTLIFSRPDNDPSNSTILGNNVIDSSSRTLNLIPASGNGYRASRSGSVTAATATGLTAVTNTPNSHHQQQLIQLQKQQQQQQHLPARTKSPSSNANVYSDRLPSAMPKFSNGISVFSQTLTQGNSPTQSPQWKTPAKVGPIPSSQASTSSAKSLPQQQGRTQFGVSAAGPTQISVGVNVKSSSSGQQFPSNNLSPSSAGGVVGSPPTSISKSTGSGPRTTSGSKAGPSSTMPLSSQPSKNAPPSSSRKSSPVSSRHVLFSNSNVGSAQNHTAKPQHQQQQQLPKQSFQQTQAYFSNVYMQAHSPQSTTTHTTTGYHQKRQSELQQPQNSSALSSTGMLSLCSPPVTFSGAAASDPAKAVTASASNLKGLPTQGLLHAAQCAPQSAGNQHLLIPYNYSLSAVPVKSAEQKPAAGNDNLHPSWQPEKR